MCNCLEMPCKVCGFVMLPVHLIDFMTKPEEIEVYCKSHIPDEDVSVFTISHRTTSSYPKRVYRKGWKMGIRYLTENARNYAYGNFPNLGVDWVREDR